MTSAPESLAELLLGKSPLEMFYRWEKETPDQVYLRQPKNLQWTEYTWAEVADQVRRIATYLVNKSYPVGSRIGIWSANSKDWPICDLAIMLAGHISVPIYPGQDTESAHYIFKHSETRLVFCGAFDQSAKVADALVEGMETVAMLGCAFKTDTSLELICANHQPYAESPVPVPDDVFSILYTSGTTGHPKGVMHMHQTPGLVIPRILMGVEALLDQVNTELSPYEKVSNIFVVPGWTIESGYLTPTMKVKRKKIEQVYRDIVENNLSGKRVESLSNEKIEAPAV